MAARGGVVGQVSDIDRHQVHRDAPRYRAALAGNDDLGATGPVDAAGGAEISVGVTGRYDRKFSRTPRGPGAAIADALALLDIAHLHDAGFQVDDRLHRIISFGCRIDAVERSARTH